MEEEDGQGGEEKGIPWTAESRAHSTGALPGPWTEPAHVNQPLFQSKRPRQTLANCEDTFGCLLFLVLVLSLARSRLAAYNMTEERAQSAPLSSRIPASPFVLTA